MTDRDETKKFLYDVELDTPYHTLADNYDEQLRAVLNYSPILNVRVLKGFNECPVEEEDEPDTPPVTVEPRWQGTYIEWNDTDTSPLEVTDRTAVGFSGISVFVNMLDMYVQQGAIDYSHTSLTVPVKATKSREHTIVDTDFIWLPTGDKLTSDEFNFAENIELWFMPTNETQRSFIEARLRGEYFAVPISRG